jgi:hypothetical protein
VPAPRHTHRKVGSATGERPAAISQADFQRIREPFHDLTLPMTLPAHERHGTANMDRRHTIIHLTHLLRQCECGWGTQRVLRLTKPQLHDSVCSVGWVLESLPVGDGWCTTGGRRVDETRARTYPAAPGDVQQMCVRVHRFNSARPLPSSAAASRPQLRPAMEALEEKLRQLEALTTVRRRFVRLRLLCQPQPSTRHPGVYRPTHRSQDRTGGAMRSPKVGGFSAHVLCIQRWVVSPRWLYAAVCTRVPVDVASWWVGAETLASAVTVATPAPGTQGHLGTR